jgi:hypothetical protein
VNSGKKDKEVNSPAHKRTWRWRGNLVARRTQLAQREAEVFGGSNVSENGFPVK